MTSIRIEAENMVLKNYRTESNSQASNGKFINLLDAAELTGTAATVFTGTAGDYNVVVAYYDENDGVSQLQVSLEDTLLDRWSLDKNLGSGAAKPETLVRRTVATGLSLEAGKTIKLQGTANQAEWARVDYIEFTPVIAETSPNKGLKIEAEQMTLQGYRLASNSYASGGQLIDLVGGDPSETGKATFTFTGASGKYDIVLGYFDETDGISHLEVSKQGQLLNAWDFNQNLGSSQATGKTRSRHTIATGLVINQGETFQIRGSENNGEPARIDYIEFIPVTAGRIVGTEAGELLVGDAKDNSIYGLGGNDTLRGGAGQDRLDGGAGIDTADYSQATNGIIAKLDQGIVLAPIYGTATKPKIMPLGDSITAGAHRVDPTPGAYRIQLWNDFVADGLNINFVGSQSNEPSTLGDRDHEGHGGWTIDQISGLVNDGLLATYQPEVVLLMIGTNSIGFDSVSAASGDLSYLIDRMTQQSPQTQLLVSSIAPTNPAITGETRARKTKEFNALLPGLVNDKVAQGKKVSFVNAGGSLSLDDLVADGVHPSATGYKKLGNAWYDSLVERDTLVSIENITGSAFADKLVGNSAANVLEGGGGNDTLTGGTGADTFVYRGILDGHDIITDFSIDDRISLAAAGFGDGLVAGTNLSTTATATGVFVSGDAPVAIGTSANFLYNTSTGVLSCDIDGSGLGLATSFVTLAGAPALSRTQLRIS